MLFNTVESCKSPLYTINRCILNIFIIVGTVCIKDLKVGYIIVQHFPQSTFTNMESDTFSGCDTMNLILLVAVIKWI